ncbi:hypothetical protein FB45DRAFT_941397 [Roridomyces roridus]|uniref:Uncharacterized protein n=1 Tax=Roridomyces roridus TaxID=1738132 RepID=A0AAD7F9Y4_9AGAR|nr:hypothetical protein FB45DRAFT_941397 [Roridomyces roridus]
MGNQDIWELINWMKRVPEPPEDLIELWERVDWALSFPRSDLIRDSQELYAYSQSDPSLGHISETLILLSRHSVWNGPCLFWLHTVLEVSWDDILTSVRALRSPAVSSALHDSGDAYKKIVLGLMTLMRKILDGELPARTWDYFRGDSLWSLAILESPSFDPELLDAFCTFQFVPTCSTLQCPKVLWYPQWIINHVLDWLKEFPGCSSDIVADWEKHLVEANLASLDDVPDSSEAANYGEGDSDSDSEDELPPLRPLRPLNNS